MIRLRPTLLYCALWDYKRTESRTFEKRAASSAMPTKPLSPDLPDERTGFVNKSENSVAIDEPKPGTVLTIDDVATILRCSKSHVCNVLNGRIPGVPKLTHFAMGRRKLVRREWLEEWMETNKCQ